MRRIVFEDPVLESKVTLDVSEELFQDIRDHFGKKRLRLYLGQLAIQSLQRALHPERFPEKKKDDGVHVEGE